jgi:hypothetical protein
VFYVVDPTTGLALDAERAAQLRKHVLAALD